MKRRIVRIYVKCFFDFKAFSKIRRTPCPARSEYTSADSGIDAGQTLKAALAEAGGRGGGAARIAQGSVPDAGLIDKVLAKLQ